MRDDNYDGDASLQAHLASIWDLLAAIVLGSAASDGG